MRPNTFSRRLLGITKERDSGSSWVISIGQLPRAVPGCTNLYNSGRADGWWMTSEARNLPPQIMRGDEGLTTGPAIPRYPLTHSHLVTTDTKSNLGIQYLRPEYHLDCMSSN